MDKNVLDSFYTTHWRNYREKNIKTLKNTDLESFFSEGTAAFFGVCKDILDEVFNNMLNNIFLSQPTQSLKIVF